MSKSLTTLFGAGVLMSLAAISGCNGNSSSTSVSDARPPANSNSNNGGGPAPVPGTSCVSSDPNHICIGVKVVSYKDSSGNAALSQAAATTMIQQVNGIWQTCNVGFQIEEYDAVDPTTYGLTYGANSENELTQIRTNFSNNTTFLVAATGPWNTSTIAWTEMPGGPPYGVVVDSDYASDPVAVGHELGHYQGLDHDQTTGNLMYPIVYSTDTTLTSAQCAQAVSTDQSFWPAMLRH